MGRIAILAILSLTACGVSVSGEVDGEPVGGAREAVFDEVEINLGPLGDFKTMAVMITDVKDSCRVYDTINDQTSVGCEARCADLSAVANEDLGADDYFQILLVLTADPDRVEGDFSFVGGVPGEDAFTGSFARFDVSALYDEQGCIDTCEAGNPIVESNPEDASGGALTVNGYESGEGIRGSFDLEFGAESVDGSFNAKRCDNISSWIGLGQ